MMNELHEVFLYYFLLVLDLLEAIEHAIERY